MTTDSARPYTLEFYDDPITGRAPVHEWITTALSRYQRLALSTAMSEILQKHGLMCAMRSTASSWVEVASNSACITRPRSSPSGRVA